MCDNRRPGGPIRFHGTPHSRDATDIATDPRIGDITRWLADAGYWVSLGTYLCGCSVVTIDRLEVDERKTFPGASMYDALAQAAAHVAEVPA